LRSLLPLPLLPLLLLLLLLLPPPPLLRLRLPRVPRPPVGRQVGLGRVRHVQRQQVGLAAEGQPLPVERRLHAHDRRVVGAGLALGAAAAVAAARGGHAADVLKAWCFVVVGGGGGGGEVRRTKGVSLSTGRRGAARARRFRPLRRRVFCSAPVNSQARKVCSTWATKLCGLEGVTGGGGGRARNK
jgi:hypothetical protein